MTRRSNGEATQWRLPDGAVGTQTATHGDVLVLQISRPNWPFPKLVAVNAMDCELVKAQPVDTNTLEEARW